MTRLKTILVLAGLILAIRASAQSTQVPYKFTPGTAAKAAEVNANFDYLKTRVDSIPAGPVGPQGPQGDKGEKGDGFSFKGPWDSGTTYKINDVVTWKGSSYVAVTGSNSNNTPDATGSTSWALFAAKGDSTSTDARFGNNTNMAAEGRSGPDCYLGEIRLMAGVVAAGAVADGRLFPIAQNQALFSLLGTTYGGNGTTTFAIPDLRGAAPNGLTYSICLQGIYPSRN